jgi:hypothetical protein
MRKKSKTSVIVGAVLLLSMIHGCEGEPGEGYRCTSDDDPCEEVCGEDYSECLDDCYACELCEESYDECLDDCGSSGGMSCESTEPTGLLSQASL